MNIKSGKLNSENLSYILINISDMLDSGMNILSSMDILESAIEGKKNKILIRRMKENIKNGNSISETFRKENSIPRLCSEIVAIGEETGRLNKVLIKLSSFYTKVDVLKKQIIASLTYPLILFFLLLIMVFFLFIILVPSFSEMYSSMEIIPSGVLKKLFEVRTFSEDNTLIFYLYLILYGVLLPPVIVVYLVKELAVRDIIKLKIISQFKEYIMLMILDLIFESGINIQKVFNKFSEEIKIPLFKNHIKNINEGLLKGKSLKEILEAQGIFSEYTIAMITIAEEIGKLNDNIKRALTKSEENLLIKTKKISNVIQPAFILIISFLIVGVVLTFLMPLYQGIQI